MADWTAGSNNSRLSVAAKYLCDNDIILRGKINNASMIALSYQQRIRKGNGFFLNDNMIAFFLFNLCNFFFIEIMLTFSINLDSKSFNNGGHKMGVSLELEPWI